MKKLLIVLVLLLGGAMIGCDGMIQTSRERQLRNKQIRDVQYRQLVDDWDTLWLYEHNSRLTEWHPRVGI